LPDNGLSNGQGCPITQTAACNGGCDPTSKPSYYNQIDAELFGDQYTELKGYIVHNTVLPGYLNTLPELPLANRGTDPDALTYLQEQCGTIVSDGDGAGVCRCGN
jgi:hypothetical protein